MQKGCYFFGNGELLSSPPFFIYNAMEQPKHLNTIKTEYTRGGYIPTKILFTPKEEQDIIKLYHEHKSMRKTATFAGYDRYIIQKVINKYGIEKYPTNSNKLSVNYDYFKDLTIGSSYFLGLWVADGSVSIARNNNTYFNLSLKKDDAYILELLKKELGSDHKIIDDRQMCKLSIGDNRLLLNIAKWGIEWEDKTHRLTDCVHLFNELDKASTTHHFIRGFFDGDGCVSMPTYRPNTSVSFSGTEAFISKIREIINERCGTTGNFRSDRPYRNVDGFYYALAYTGIHISIKILRWLYQDKGEYYLKRKHDIYSRLIV